MINIANFTSGNNVQVTDVTHQTAGPWTEDSDERLGSSPSSVGTLCATRASTSIPSVGIDQDHK